MKANIKNALVSVKGRAYASAAALVPLMASGVHAQTTTSYTPTSALGTSNYGLLTQNFSDALAPILGQVLPFAIILMAIWFGPGLFHRLLKQFSH